jgi:hypothetical protein
MLRHQPGGVADERERVLSDAPAAGQNTHQTEKRTTDDAL